MPVYIVVVQSLSHIQLFATPWTAAHQSFLSFTKGLARVVSSTTVWFFFQHQFESINSLALNLPYGPTLISIHEYWKNHSFD